MDNFRENSFDDLNLDHWLESFFLDPHTSFLDQTQFRIDIFETSTHFIIEALLSGFEHSNVFVDVENGTIIITAKREESVVKERRIELPFQVNQRKIKAYLNNGILEVFIFKNKSNKPKNRRVKIK